MATVETIYVGTIIHSISQTQLAYLNPGILGVNTDGTIAFVHTLPPSTPLDTFLATLTSNNTPTIRHLPAHTLLLPGFIDTHIHAPQYPFSGTGYTLPLLTWLTTYTFPHERRFSSLSYAETIYKRVVAKSLRCGTTTAAWYGTIHTPATILLARTCVEMGQRALVGKVCMDRNGGDGYVENSAEQSCEDTIEFIRGVRQLGSELVQPILTPRFAVSCTKELLASISSLSDSENLRIQTHCAENIQECTLVESLFHLPYVQAYHSCGILGPKTILAHCIHLNDSDRELLSRTQTSISHCPVSNFALSSGICNVRALLDAGISVGLGTDVAGGWSTNLLTAIRNALIASRVLSMRDGTVPLSLEEGVYMATLGGAKTLGLDAQTGNFVNGKYFDAILVDLDACADGRRDHFASRSVDVFEGEGPQECFEKFLFLGDERNVVEVFVAGRRVFCVDE
ncbi:guanine deaminase [Spizellomyces punctatus DAOM BR117]|uniref:Guanine deaminase n=1 Tax=Spizellomyces punctatus (strain DAOM BR117) TaxID=645134 RepID=A0A0L0HV83_SPIPD|nr:guanine deaminase [Spizellomyces punctatus DAOM BR117]KND04997.1 guanine deaminase [Spizellomyces punctatus DAOM BR117]|eukprot:XP_016613036.1 guanine deaminase [Spizellomyces punctatus DAOM BR117]